LSNNFDKTCLKTVFKLKENFEKLICELHVLFSTLLHFAILYERISVASAGFFWHT